ncbi:MAG: GNAT family N-acetyltransferase, partial [Candidatus Omnitrophica bacterium]|nr:GNAT family N-acetyltransferase [Candidatus Omnitrophota bacterium]
MKEQIPVMRWAWLAALAVVCVLPAFGREAEEVVQKTALPKRIFESIGWVIVGTVLLGGAIILIQKIAKWIMMLADVYNHDRKPKRGSRHHKVEKETGLDSCSDGKSWWFAVGRWIIGFLTGWLHGRWQGGWRRIYSEEYDTSRVFYVAACRAKFIQDAIKEMRERLANHPEVLARFEKVLERTYFYRGPSGSKKPPFCLRNPLRDSRHVFLGDMRDHRRKKENYELVCHELRAATSDLTHDENVDLGRIFDLTQSLKQRGIPLGRLQIRQDELLARIGRGKPNDWTAQDVPENPGTVPHVQSAHARRFAHLTAMLKLREERLKALAKELSKGLPSPDRMLDFQEALKFLQCFGLASDAPLDKKGEKKIMAKRVLARREELLQCALSLQRLIKKRELSAAAKITKQAATAKRRAEACYFLSKAPAGDIQGFLQAIARMKEAGETLSPFAVDVLEAIRQGHKPWYLESEETAAALKTSKGGHHNKLPLPVRPSGADHCSDGKGWWTALGRWIKGLLIGLFHGEGMRGWQRIDRTHYETARKLARAARVDGARSLVVDFQKEHRSSFSRGSRRGLLWRALDRILDSVEGRRNEPRVNEILKHTYYFCSSEGINIPSFTLTLRTPSFIRILGVPVIDCRFVFFGFMPNDLPEQARKNYYFQVLHEVCAGLGLTHDEADKLVGILGIVDLCDACGGRPDLSLGEIVRRYGFPLEELFVCLGTPLEGLLVPQGVPTEDFLSRRVGSLDDFFDLVGLPTDTFLALRDSLLEKLGGNVRDWTAQEDVSQVQPQAERSLTARDIETFTAGVDRQSLPRAAMEALGQFDMMRLALEILEQANGGRPVLACVGSDVRYAKAISRDGQLTYLKMFDFLGARFESSAIVEVLRFLGDYENICRENPELGQQWVLRVLFNVLTLRSLQNTETSGVMVLSPADLAQIASLKNTLQEMEERRRDRTLWHEHLQPSIDFLREFRRISEQKRAEGAVIGAITQSFCQGAISVPALKNIVTRDLMNRVLCTLYGYGEGQRSAAQKQNVRCTLQAVIKVLDALLDQRRAQFIKVGDFVLLDVRHLFSNAAAVPGDRPLAKPRQGKSAKQVREYFEFLQKRSYARCVSVEGAAWVHRTFLAYRLIHPEDAEFIDRIEKNVKVYECADEQDVFWGASNGKIDHAVIVVARHGIPEDPQEAEMWKVGVLAHEIREMIVVAQGLFYARAAHEEAETIEELARWAYRRERSQETLRWELAQEMIRRLHNNLGQAMALRELTGTLLNHWRRPLAVTEFWQQSEAFSPLNSEEAHAVIMSVNAGISDGEPDHVGWNLMIVMVLARVRKVAERIFLKDRSYQALLSKHSTQARKRRENIVVKALSEDPIIQGFSDVAPARNKVVLKKAVADRLSDLERVYAQALAVVYSEDWAHVLVTAATEEEILCSLARFAALRKSVEAFEAAWDWLRAIGFSKQAAAVTLKQLCQATDQAVQELGGEADMPAFAAKRQASPAKAEPEVSSKPMSRKLAQKTTPPPDGSKYISAAELKEFIQIVTRGTLTGSERQALAKIELFVRMLEALEVQNGGQPVGRCTPGGDIIFADVIGRGDRLSERKVFGILDQRFKTKDVFELIQFIRNHEILHQEYRVLEDNDIFRIQFERLIEQNRPSSRGSMRAGHAMSAAGQRFAARYGVAVVFHWRGLRWVTPLVHWLMRCEAGPQKIKVPVSILWLERIGLIDKNDELPGRVDPAHYGSPRGFASPFKWVAPVVDQYIKWATDPLRLGVPFSIQLMQGIGLIRQNRKQFDHLNQNADMLKEIAHKSFRCGMTPPEQYPVASHKPRGTISKFKLTSTVGEKVVADLIEGGGVKDISLVDVWVGPSLDEKKIRKVAGDYFGRVWPILEQALQGPEIHNCWNIMGRVDLDTRKNSEGAVNLALGNSYPKEEIAILIEEVYLHESYPSEWEALWAQSRLLDCHVDYVVDPETGYVAATVRCKAGRISSKRWAGGAAYVPFDERSMLRRALDLAEVANEVAIEWRTPFIGAATVIRDKNAISRKKRKSWTGRRTKVLTSWARQSVRNRVLGFVLTLTGHLGTEQEDLDNMKEAAFSAARDMLTAGALTIVPEMQALGIIKKPELSKDPVREEYLWKILSEKGFILPQGAKGTLIGPYFETRKDFQDLPWTDKAEAKMVYNALLRVMLRPYGFRRPVAGCSLENDGLPVSATDLPGIMVEAQVRVLRGGILEDVGVLEDSVMRASGLDPERISRILVRKGWGKRNGTKVFFKIHLAEEQTQMAAAFGGDFPMVRRLLQQSVRKWLNVIIIGNGLTGRSVGRCLARRALPNTVNILALADTSGTISHLRGLDPGIVLSLIRDYEDPKSREHFTDFAEVKCGAAKYSGKFDFIPAPKFFGEQLFHQVVYNRETDVLVFADRRHPPTEAQVRGLKGKVRVVIEAVPGVFSPEKIEILEGMGIIFVPSLMIDGSGFYAAREEFMWESPGEPLAIDSVRRVQSIVTETGLALSYKMFGKMRRGSWFLPARLLRHITRDSVRRIVRQKTLWEKRMSRFAKDRGINVRDIDASGLLRLQGATSPTGTRAGGIRRALSPRKKFIHKVFSEAAALSRQGSSAQEALSRALDREIHTAVMHGEKDRAFQVVLPALAADHKDPMQQRLAAFDCARMRLTEAIPALVALLRSPTGDPNARANAAYALGLMRDKIPEPTSIVIPRSRFAGVRLKAFPLFDPDKAGSIFEPAGPDSVRLKANIIMTRLDVKRAMDYDDEFKNLWPILEPILLKFDVIVSLVQAMNDINEDMAMWARWALEYRPINTAALLGYFQKEVDEGRTGLAGELSLESAYHFWTQGLFCQANIYELAGDNEKAIVILNEAVAIATRASQETPNQGPVRFLLRVAAKLSKMKKTAEAVKEYCKVVSPVGTEALVKYSIFGGGGEGAILDMRLSAIRGILGIRDPHMAPRTQAEIAEKVNQMMLALSDRRHPVTDFLDNEFEAEGLSICSLERAIAKVVYNRTRVHLEHVTWGSGQSVFLNGFLRNPLVFAAFVEEAQQTQKVVGQNRFHAYCVLLERIKDRPYYELSPEEQVEMRSAIRNLLEICLPECPRMANRKKDRDHDKAIRECRLAELYDMAKELDQYCVPGLGILLAYGTTIFFGDEYALLRDMFLYLLSAPQAMSHDNGLPRTWDDTLRCLAHDYRVSSGLSLDEMFPRGSLEERAEVTKALTVLEALEFPVYEQQQEAYPSAEPEADTFEPGRPTRGCAQSRAVLADDVERDTSGAGMIPVVREWLGETWARRVQAFGEQAVFGAVACGLAALIGEPLAGIVTWLGLFFGAHFIPSHMPRPPTWRLLLIASLNALAFMLPAGWFWPAFLAVSAFHQVFNRVTFISQTTSSVAPKSCVEEPQEKDVISMAVEEISVDERILWHEDIRPLMGRFLREFIDPAAQDGQRIISAVKLLRIRLDSFERFLLAANKLFLMAGLALAACYAATGRQFYIAASAGLFFISFVFRMFHKIVKRRQNDILQRGGRFVSIVHDRTIELPSQWQSFDLAHEFGHFVAAVLRVPDYYVLGCVVSLMAKGYLHNETVSSAIERGRRYARALQQRGKKIEDQILEDLRELDKYCRDNRLFVDGDYIFSGELVGMIRELYPHDNRRALSFLISLFRQINTSPCTRVLKNSPDTRDLSIVPSTFFAAEDLEGKSAQSSKPGDSDQTAGAGMIPVVREWLGETWARRVQALGEQGVFAAVACGLAALIGEPLAGIVTWLGLFVGAHFIPSHMPRPPTWRLLLIASLNALVFLLPATWFWPAFALVTVFHHVYNFAKLQEQNIQRCLTGYEAGLSGSQDFQAGFGGHDLERKAGLQGKKVSVLAHEDTGADVFGKRGDHGVSGLEPHCFVPGAEIKGDAGVIVDGCDVCDQQHEFFEGLNGEVVADFRHDHAGNAQRVLHEDGVQQVFAGGFFVQAEGENKLVGVKNDEQGVPPTSVRGPGGAWRSLPPPSSWRAANRFLRSWRAVCSAWSGFLSFVGTSWGTSFLNLKNILFAGTSQAWVRAAGWLMCVGAGILSLGCSATDGTSVTGWLVLLGSLAACLMAALYTVSVDSGRARIPTSAPCIAPKKQASGKETADRRKDLLQKTANTANRITTQFVDEMEKLLSLDHQSGPTEMIFRYVPHAHAMWFDLAFHNMTEPETTRKSRKILFLCRLYAGLFLNWERENPTEKIMSALPEPARSLSAKQQRPIKEKINALQALIRPWADKITALPQFPEVQEVDVLAITQRALKAAGGSAKFHAGPDLPRIRTDQEILEAALFEMFTDLDQCGVLISGIKIRRLPGRAYVEIAVSSDYCPDREFAAIALCPDFHVYEGDDRGGGATQHLFAAKSLVESLGGSFDMQCHFPKGDDVADRTTFVIRLPVAQAKKGAERTGRARMNFSARCIGPAPEKDQRPTGAIGLRSMKKPAQVRVKIHNRPLSAICEIASIFFESMKVEIIFTQGQGNRAEANSISQLLLFFPIINEGSIDVEVRGDHSVEILEKIFRLVEAMLGERDIDTLGSFAFRRFIAEAGMIIAASVEGPKLTGAGMIPRVREWLGETWARRVQALGEQAVFGAIGRCLAAFIGGTLAGIVTWFGLFVAAHFIPSRMPRPPTERILLVAALNALAFALPAAWFWPAFALVTVFHQIFNLATLPADVSIVADIVRNIDIAKKRLIGGKVAEALGDEEASRLAGMIAERASDPYFYMEKGGNLYLNICFETLLDQLEAGQVTYNESCFWDKPRLALGNEFSDAKSVGVGPSEALAVIILDNGVYNNARNRNTALIRLIDVGYQVDRFTRLYEPVSVEEIKFIAVNEAAFGRIMNLAENFREETAKIGAVLRRMLERNQFVVLADKDFMAGEKDILVRHDKPQPLPPALTKLGVRDTRFHPTLNNVVYWTLRAPQMADMGKKLRKPGFAAPALQPGSGSAAAPKASFFSRLLAKAPWMLTLGVALAAAVLAALSFGLGHRVLPIGLVSVGIVFSCFLPLIFCVVPVAASWLAEPSLDWLYHGLGKTILPGQGPVVLDVDQMATCFRLHSERMRDAQRFVDFHCKKTAAGIFILQPTSSRYPLVMPRLIQEALQKAVAADPVKLSRREFTGTSLAQTGRALLAPAGIVKAAELFSEVTTFILLPADPVYRIKERKALEKLIFNFSCPWMLKRPCQGEAVRPKDLLILRKTPLNLLPGTMIKLYPPFFCLDVDQDGPVPSPFTDLKDRPKVIAWVENGWASAEETSGLRSALAQDVLACLRKREVDAFFAGRDLAEKPVVKNGGWTFKENIFEEAFAKHVPKEVFANGPVFRESHFRRLVAALKNPQSELFHAMQEDIAWAVKGQQVLWDMLADEEAMEPVRPQIGEIEKEIRITKYNLEELLARWRRLAWAFRPEEVLYASVAGLRSSREQEPWRKETRDPTAQDRAPAIPEGWYFSQTEQLADEIEKTQRQIEGLDARLYEIMQDAVLKYRQTILNNQASSQGGEVPSGAGMIPVVREWLGETWARRVQALGEQGVFAAVACGLAALIGEPLAGIVTWLGLFFGAHFISSHMPRPPTWRILLVAALNALVFLLPAAWFWPAFALVTAFHHVFNLVTFKEQGFEMRSNYLRRRYPVGSTTISVAENPVTAVSVRASRRTAWTAVADFFRNLSRIIPGLLSWGKSTGLPKSVSSVRSTRPVFCARANTPASFRPWSLSSAMVWTSYWTERRRSTVSLLTHSSQRITGLPGKMDLFVADHGRGILDAGREIRPCQLGKVVGQDVVERGPVGDQVQDLGDHDPVAFDTWLAMAYRWIGVDTVKRHGKLLSCWFKNTTISAQSQTVVIAVIVALAAAVLAALFFGLALAGIFVAHSATAAPAGMGTIVWIAVTLAAFFLIRPVVAPNRYSLGDGMSSAAAALKLRSLGTIEIKDGNGEGYVFTYRRISGGGWLRQSGAFQITVSRKGIVVGHIDVRGNNTGLSFESTMRIEEPGLLVDEPYWHLGLGRALLTLAMGISRLRGHVEFLACKVDPSRRVVKFYTDLGFEPDEKIAYMYRRDLRCPLPAISIKARSSQVEKKSAGAGMIPVVREWLGETWARRVQALSEQAVLGAVACGLAALIGGPLAGVVTWFGLFVGAHFIPSHMPRPPTWRILLIASLNALVFTLPAAWFWPAFIAVTAFHHFFNLATLPETGDASWVAIQLAAGKGERMKTVFPMIKPLIPLAGKAIMQYFLDAARIAGVKTFTVIPKDDQAIRAGIVEGSCEVVPAAPGTINAFLAPYPHLKKFSGNIIVVPADCLISDPRVLTSAMNRHAPRNGQAAWVTAFSAVVSRPHSFERMVRRKDGTLETTVRQYEIDALRAGGRTLRLSDGTELSADDLDRIRETWSGVILFRSSVYKFAGFLGIFWNLFAKGQNKNPVHGPASPRPARPVEAVLRNIRTRGKLFRFFLGSGLGRIYVATQSDSILNLNTPEDVTPAEEVVRAAAARDGPATPASACPNLFSLMLLLSKYGHPSQYIASRPKLVQFFIFEIFRRLDCDQQEEIMKAFHYYETQTGHYNFSEPAARGFIAEQAAIYSMERGRSVVDVASDEEFQDWLKAQPYRRFFEIAGIEKAGQFLSTQKDWIPEGFRQAFEVFQENCKPGPIADVMAEIEMDLGAPLSQVFAPLEDQMPAAVVVQRGILLRGLARVFPSWFAAKKDFQPTPGMALAETPFLRRLKTGTVAETFYARLQSGEEVVLKIVTPAKKARVLAGLRLIGEVLGELEKKRAQFASKTEAIRLSPERFFKGFK